jgi:5-methyltetrahydropteroyltriglutamate--homocysteine methyltransferase
MPTTVVGSYPQPHWLIDHELLMAVNVPRARMLELWRVPEPYLEAAQDDATLLAIRDMERAGIDIITDGEVRRESYSNRFATSLEGVVAPDPNEGDDDAAAGRRPLPVVVGPIRRTSPVEVRDLEFLRANTDRRTKITLPGPFTMAQLIDNRFYEDRDELVMDLAAAVNAEVLDLQAAGADVIQLDEPWLRNDPQTAERIAITAIDAALAGVHQPTAIHLCFGYAARVGGKKPSEYQFLAQLSDSTVDQVSIEAAQPGIDLGVLADLAGK